MIIACHGQYTTAPPTLETYRRQQIESLKSASAASAVEPTSCSR